MDEKRMYIAQVMVDFTIRFKVFETYFNTVCRLLHHYHNSTETTYKASNDFMNNKD